MKSVCVFCGSRSGGRSIYTEVTQALARAIAGRGLELVYGAGDVGLMGVLADEVLRCGGRVIGVIPTGLVQREVAHPRLTECIVTDTMHQRKAIMADRADAFLALPGGYGTMDELFEILTWAQLGIHQKPIGLLDVAGFFAPLLTWVERAVAEGFIRERHRGLLLVENDPDRLLERLASHVPSDPGEKWVTRADR